MIKDLIYIVVVGVMHFLKVNEVPEVFIFKALTLQFDFKIR